MNEHAQSSWNLLLESKIMVGEREHHAERSKFAKLQNLYNEETWAILMELILAGRHKCRTPRSRRRIMPRRLSTEINQHGSGRKPHHTYILYQLALCRIKSCAPGSTRKRVGMPNTCTSC